MIRAYLRIALWLCLFGMTFCNWKVVAGPFVDANITAFSRGVKSTDFPKSTDIISVSAHNNPKDGVAYLTWTIGLGSTDQYKYQILRKLKDSVNWKIIDEIVYAGTPISYNDSAFICSDSVSYKIIRNSSSDMINWTYKDSDTTIIFVEDRAEPKHIEIQNVSVVENPLGVELMWHVSPSVDAKGYILTREEAGNPIALDTVQGVNKTNYTDLATDVNATTLDIKKYRIRVFDGCRNQSINSEPKNIFTTKVEYRWCDDSVRVTYTDPINSITSIDSVFLYAKSDRLANYVRLFGQKYNLGEARLFTYPAADGVSYSFYKVVVSDAGKIFKSSSLYDSIKVELPSIPDYLYLQNVSVKNQNSVELYLYADTTKDFGSVIWERKDEKNDQWAEHKVFSKNELTAANIINDASVKTSSQVYSYKFRMTDVCGKERLQTPVHNTIKLVMRNGEENNSLNFEWNTYQIKQDSGKIDEFVLMLKDGNDAEKEIANITPSLQKTYGFKYSYVSIEELFKASFWVEARMSKSKGSGSNSYMVSASNRISIIENSAPVFYMPSGFRPSGITDNYGPIGYFFEDDLAQWSIFDRNGKLIFESNSTTKRWDGKYKGKPVNPGVYVYTVVISRNGETTQKRGTVTVIG